MWHPLLLLACVQPVDKPGVPEGDTAGLPDTETDADTDSDTDTDTDTDTDAGTSDCPTVAAPTCTDGAFATSPADGGFNVPTFSEVVFLLEHDDPTAVATVDGVLGTSVVAGSAVTFTPDQPFAPHQDYTARLCGCAGEDRLSFYTADGDAVPDAATLLDRTWALATPEGTLVAPAPFDGFMAAYGVSLLVQAQEADADGLRLRLAWSERYGETLTQASMGTEDAEFSFAGNPSFRASADLWEFQGLGMYPSDVMDVTFEGTFSVDGSRIEDGRLSFMADISEWAGAFGWDGTDPADMCTMLETWKMPCEPCSETQPYCWQFAWEGLEGVEVTPFELERIRAVAP